MIALLAVAGCSQSPGVVPPAPTEQVEAAADSSSRLLGTVVTPDGQPLPGASISFTFLAEDSAQLATGLPIFTTDRDGKFSAPYLPHREYAVAARMPSGFGETQTVRIEPGRVAALHFVVDTARGTPPGSGAVPGPGVVFGSRGATFAIPLAWLRTLRGGLEGLISWDSSGRAPAARPGSAGFSLHVPDSVIGSGSLTERLRSGRVRSFSIQHAGSADVVIEQEEPAVKLRLQGAMLIVGMRSGTAFNDLGRSIPDSIRVDRRSGRGPGPAAGWLMPTQVI